MKLGSKAVSSIVKLINDASLTDFEGRAYKYEKPKGVTGEYIAVNALPFLNNDVVGEGTININIHVPKLPNGLPDTLRLETLSEEIISLFPLDAPLYLDKAYWEYYCDSRPTEDNDNTYYVNLQVKVKYNNLIY